LIENALVALAEDDRPDCPTCQSSDVQRKGLIHLASGGTSQRWRCASCSRRFVSAAHRVAKVDRRTLAHFDADDPVEEAKSLFEWCSVKFGPMAGTNLWAMRGHIAVSKGDRECLELMISNGVLNRCEVERAIEFREKVLHEFDSLCAQQGW
jgi:hypothetical protein